MSNYDTGMQAEAAALAHLQKLGFTLLAQRYRNRYGEIDLIVSRDREIRFVEVKARRSLEEGLYALKPRQQQRMWQCAQGFLAEHLQYQDYALQCDLIAIAGSQLEHIEHILTSE